MRCYLVRRTKRHLLSLFLLLGLALFQQCSDTTQSPNATVQDTGTHPDAPDRSADRLAAGDTPDDSRIELDVLYLENWSETGHNQLEQLFLPKAKKVDKIVCEFVYVKPNKLSLILYSAQKKNQKFDPAKQVVLTNFSASSIDMSKYDTVVLGTNQSIDDAQLTKIKNAINRADSRYILFTPSIAKMDDNKNHVVYKLEGVKTLEEGIVPDRVPVADFNPSPPKDSY